MKYSYNWIKELSGTKKSPQQLAKLLMTHAFEVEGVERFSFGLDTIVVGEVVKLEKHPNADKLRVAEVAVGKNVVRQIVCGAPNIAVGQKVAVALPASPSGGPGAVLPDGIVIKAVSLRGVESQGMICSANELGIGDDHEGILVLPSETPTGVLFSKYFHLDDTIIEAKILPDRGSDALSHQGFAREISALDGHAPHFGEKKLKAIKSLVYSRAPKVSVSDKEGCLRYIGLSFQNIVVTQSPLWMKVKLIKLGIRPINNVVDCTNYLMLLTGQPTHAFDTDSISGGITVRKAKKREKITLLTGEVKQLLDTDLVIASDKKALALAGIMGGKDSGITEKTKNIFLEIATFDGATIRRTKSRLGLATDASYRFERNLDPNLAGEVAHEALSLFRVVCGGKFVGMRDIYPKAVKPRTILLSLDRVNNVLGSKVPLFEGVQHLALLGLKVKSVKNQKILEVIIPSRRPDLVNEWDLIEEIGRMRGYDKIVPVAPTLPLVPTVINQEKLFERTTKEYLTHSGFDEIMTYSFYGEKEILGTMLPLRDHLVVENPLSPDQKYLRMTHVPLMLRKAKENLRSFQSFDMFEWGSVFAKDSKTGKPLEVKSLGLMTVLSEKSVRGEATPEAGKHFFAMKGKVEALFNALHIDQEKISWELPEKFSSLPVVAMLHPTRSAVFVCDGKPIGVIGEFHPRTLQAFGLESRIAMAGFVASELEKLQKKEIRYAPLQKFPYAVRDISLTFQRKVTVREVEQLLREAGAPLLRQSELFDVFERDDEKNLAFHLSFGAPDRTLSSGEMDQAFDRIVALAKERFMARLRD